MLMVVNGKMWFSTELMPFYRNGSNLVSYVPDL